MIILKNSWGQVPRLHKSNPDHYAYTYSYVSCPKLFVPHSMHFIFYIHVAIGGLDW